MRTDLGNPVSGIVQQALAGYLAAGGLRRHIARSRRDYGHARTHLARLLAPHADVLHLGGLDAGLHAVIERVSALPGRLRWPSTTSRASRS